MTTIARYSAIASVAPVFSTEVNTTNVYPITETVRLSVEFIDPLNANAPIDPGWFAGIATPLFSAAIGMLFLGDVLTVPIALGALLLLVGLWVLAR